MKVEKRLKGEGIFDTLARKARPRVPFTALNTVWRMMDKEAKTMLDVGCGKGEPMRFINRRRQFYAVGADIFEPYLKEAKRQNIHKERKGEPLSNILWVVVGPLAHFFPGLAGEMVCSKNFGE